MISSAAAPRREPVPVLSVSAASLYKVVLISPLSRRFSPPGTKEIWNVMKLYH